MEERQLRVTEDGRQEIWDNTLQAWRGVQPLDNVYDRKKGKFLCPDCGAKVEMYVTFNTWELHEVDINTGYEVDMIDNGRDDDDNETEYRCAKDCGWMGDWEWWDATQNAKQKEPEAPKEVERPQPLQLELEFDILKNFGKPNLFAWRVVGNDPF